MRNLKIIILLFAMMLPIAAMAQRDGYTPYMNVGYVNNGQRTDATGGVAWVKFDGNLIFFNAIGGPVADLRYKYSDTQSDGTQVYYQQSYNVGGFGTSPGWIEIRSSWLLVSPDKKTINQVMSYGNSKNITIYKLQTASSAGDMIY